jgi:hypothetical protein
LHIHCSPLSQAREAVVCIQQFRVETASRDVTSRRIFFPAYVEMVIKDF